MKFAKIGFSIDKEVDLATPGLFQAYCLTYSKNLELENRVFGIATVTFRKASGNEDPLEYLTYRFENVIVTSYKLNTDKEGRMKESIDFRFTACSVKYTPQQKTGEGSPPSEMKGWNFETSKVI